MCRHDPHDRRRHDGAVEWAYERIKGYEGLSESCALVCSQAVSRLDLFICGPQFWQVPPPRNGITGLSSHTALCEGIDAIGTYAICGDTRIKSTYESEAEAKDLRFMSLRPRSPPPSCSSPATSRFATGTILTIDGSMTAQ
jgi:hypothetical protein